MSVIGSLEDLAFPDMLKIIHASRRSGTLILTLRDGERRVAFENGLIRDAILTPGGPGLEERLLSRGLVTRQALQGASARAARQGGSVTAALLGVGAVSQEAVEHLVREQLDASLRSLVLSQEGEFRFELGADRAPAGHVLLLVERSVVRRAAENSLRAAGFEVETCPTPESALDRARVFSRDGVDFLFVGDLILPGAGGNDWQGGLDLLRLIRRLAPGARAVLLEDAWTESAEAAAAAAGASACLRVPSLGGVSWNEIGGALEDFGILLRDALIDPNRGGAVAPGGTLRVADQVSLLRGLMGEMHPEQEIEIPLLVLRLATEFFERGVLFALQEGQAQAMGAFGEEGTGEAAGGGLDRRLRGVALRLVHGSLLEIAARTRALHVGPLSADGPDAPLIERLGGSPPGAAAVLPILEGPVVVSLLYGDNGGSGRSIGDLGGLEIFVAQAGIALQSATLRRRLTALSRRGGGRSHDR